MSRRTATCCRNEAPISSAFLREMPSISVSRSGAVSRIFRLSVPKAATIFSAVFGPTPRTAREER